MAQFDNLFIKSLPQDIENKNYPRQVLSACWSAVNSTPVKAPKLLLYSSELAEAMGFSAEQMGSKEMLQVLSGNQLLPGMVSYATCYGGHQFGYWAEQLGDGRAIFLGELLTEQKERFVMQLKGAGLTPYSRNADGRAVLRSSIREFLCSEAMHYLGIPTTRALSLVSTGETVVRDMFYNGNPQAEEGAIICRTAESFLRFGHFELFAIRNELEILKSLIQFAIQRDYPCFAIESDKILKTENLVRWFREICVRTADLICHWLRVGFVHGVMNTDNMSMIGFTLDYGPYGWLEPYEPNWTPNTTDLPGRRYCFSNQAEISMWNLSQLALAIGVILPDSEILLDVVREYPALISSKLKQMYCQKFGFEEWREADQTLITECFEWMFLAQIDYTNFFSLLTETPPELLDAQLILTCSYDSKKYEEHLPRLLNWLSQYRKRILYFHAMGEERRKIMQSVNPSFILRNYLTQQAIEKAQNGDYSMLHELFAALKKPYEKNFAYETYRKKRPDWAKQKPGCTMLSCSS